MVSPSWYTKYMRFIYGWDSEKVNTKVWNRWFSPTCHVGGVKWVKRKGENVLSIALFPQLGTSVSIPQNYVVGRVNCQQQITGCILIPQPLQVWHRKRARHRDWGMSWWRSSARQGSTESDGKSILMKRNGPKTIENFLMEVLQGRSFLTVEIQYAKNQCKPTMSGKNGCSLLPWIGLECSWISQWAVPLTTSHTMIFPEASPEASRRQ